MSHSSKVRFVYTHRVRCPSCHGFWTFQVASQEGTIVRRPNPVRIGLGLLCGACEGKRRAILVVPPENGEKGFTGRFWTERDSEAAMDILRRNPESYAIQITKSESPWDGASPLLDERQSILDVLFRKRDGRYSVGISKLFHAQHCPDWQFYISAQEGK